MKAKEELLGLLVQRTSRTFAVTIPLLPEPLRREVSIAYLLFRIVDTFEDAVLWPPAKRLQALADFVPLLDEGEPRPCQRLAQSWAAPPPVPQEQYQYVELLAATPEVIAWYRALEPGSRDLIRAHLRRTAEGMSRYVSRLDPAGGLKGLTFEELRDYCYVVAGVVGEMLTELFVASGGPGMARVAGELRWRAPVFGETLQLVNILKDANHDAGEGRVYLPAGIDRSRIFDLVRADLQASAEYVALLQAGGADSGVVGFNRLNLDLAAATVALLEHQGPGAKLSRSQVGTLKAEILRALSSEPQPAEAPGPGSQR